MHFGNLIMTSYELQSLLFFMDPTYSLTKCAYAIQELNNTSSHAGLLSSYSSHSLPINVVTSNNSLLIIVNGLVSFCSTENEREIIVCEAKVVNKLN